MKIFNFRSQTEEKPLSLIYDIRNNLNKQRERKPLKRNQRNW